MYDLSNQVVIITGATGNLGHAITQTFRASGARLILVDRSADHLQQEFPDLVNEPGHYLASCTDLTHPDDVEAALKQAIEMWKTERREAYFCGEAAYEHWLGWLNGIESGAIENPKNGMQGNAWCFDVLVHGRRIAGRWLREKAQGFVEPARGLILQAADHYSQIAETCMKDLNSSWDLAPGPHRLDQWTRAMRQSQIHRLQSARELDRAAIVAIESALP